MITFAQSIRSLALALLVTATVGARAQSLVSTSSQQGFVSDSTATLIPSTVPAKSGKSKNEYTGPTTVIELAATPMIDREGRQRLDPNGKPMFNAAIRQMRDKKGHPVFEESGKPVFQTSTDLGYDERGKRIPVIKVKTPKTVALNIISGTFTVDGMPGRAALNYDIADLKYIYLYVPWIGTTIVSNVMFPGATEQPNAFNDRTLTVTVENHILEIDSDSRLLGKNPAPAYVLVDRDFQLPTKRPVVGYGPTLKAPYEWPGAKQTVVATGKTPPPVPANLRPTLLLSPCPAGQMRPVGPRPLPGEPALVEPCIPISQATAQVVAQRVGQQQMAQ